MKRAEINRLRDYVSGLRAQADDMDSYLDTVEVENTTLVGVCSNSDSESDFATLVSMLGPLGLHYTFQPKLLTYWGSTTGSKCAGHLPMISVKLTTSNTQDQVQTFVNSIPSDGQTRRLVVYQEPEDNLSMATFLGFAQMFRKAIGARTDILLCCDLQCYWNYHKSANHDASAAYIGNGIFDVVGWSWWPYGQADDLDLLRAAINVTVNNGARFAISSLITSNWKDLAQLTNSIYESSVALVGLDVDHLVAYGLTGNAVRSEVAVREALVSLFNVYR